MSLGALMEALQTGTRCWIIAPTDVCTYGVSVSCSHVAELSARGQGIVHDPESHGCPYHAMPQGPLVFVKLACKDANQHGKAQNGYQDAAEGCLQKGSGVMSMCAKRSTLHLNGLHGEFNPVFTRVFLSEFLMSFSMDALRDQ
jgi:hypothetical protein